MKTDLSVFAECIVKDFYGLSALYRGLETYFVDMNLVFTVFGPAYYLRKRTLHLFGFAQPNIIYPNNPVSDKKNLIDRTLTNLKFRIQAWFFSRADAIVVELEHVKVELQKITLFKRKPIYIVYSSVHSVFNNRVSWGPLLLPTTTGQLKLGIISRNYPHKNLAMLPQVKYYLLKNHNLSVDFFVTFQPDEWSKCSPYFREQVVNVGGLSLNQCPTFYSLMDGVIFPSLLECFSAVPIEAMMVRKPLFASNLSFIRDVCGDKVNYFDPLDPIDIAHVIYDYFNLSPERRAVKVEEAYFHAGRFPGPVERSNNYIQLIKEILISKDK